MHPTYTFIDSTQFHALDWIEFYDDVKEPIPSNSPLNIGKTVDLACLLIVIMLGTSYPWILSWYSNIPYYWTCQLVFEETVRCVLLEHNLWPRRKAWRP